VEQTLRGPVGTGFVLFLPQHFPSPSLAWELLMAVIEMMGRGNDSAGGGFP